MSGIGTGVSRSAARRLGRRQAGCDHPVLTFPSLWLSQYDLSTGTFSPDGRVFQTDYAQKAVDNSGCGRVEAGGALFSLRSTVRHHWLHVTFAWCHTYDGMQLIQIAHLVLQHGRGHSLQGWRSAGALRSGAAPL